MEFGNNGISVTRLKKFHFWDSRRIGRRSKRDDEVIKKSLRILNGDFSDEIPRNEFPSLDYERNKRGSKYIVLCFSGLHKVSFICLIRVRFLARTLETWRAWKSWKFSRDENYSRDIAWNYSSSRFLDYTIKPPFTIFRIYRLMIRQTILTF